MFGRKKKGEKAEKPEKATKPKRNRKKKGSSVVPMGTVVVVIIVAILAVPAIVGGSLFFLLTAITADPGLVFPAEPVIHANGASLNGTWEVESPTANGELITIVFSDGAFTKVSERFFADAAIQQIMEDFDSIREFYRVQQGGEVEVEGADGGILLRVTISGLFSLSGNEMLMSTGGGNILTVVPFSWDGTRMIISGDSFERA